MRVPILLFADDMVLLGRSAHEIQEMLSICEEWANAMDMEFNEKKSAVLCFNGIEDDLRWSIQGKVVEGKKCYKYLGVNISAGVDMF